MMPDSKKVYTATFHNVPNVGALLQAYGLQNFISRLGYETEILNYRPRYQLFDLVRPTKGFTRNVDRMRMYFLAKHFARDRLKVTDIVVRRPEDLELFADAHAFVCGSDQIWNPILTGGRRDPVFFFAGEMAALKIAYAASAGGHQFDPREVSTVRNLKDFSAVGVREGFLAANLRDTGIFASAQNVVDPTFLVESWEPLTSGQKRPSGAYIASYEVSQSGSRRKFNEAVQALKELTGLPVHHLGSNRISSADHSGPVSPERWLAMMSGAEFVCTNSFHGLAIALKFQKKVIFISHHEEEKNARAFGLLKSAELTHLIYTNKSEITKGKINQDYSITELDKLVLESKNFLQAALEIRN